MRDFMRKLGTLLIVMLELQMALLYYFKNEVKIEDPTIFNEESSRNKRSKRTNRTKQTPSTKEIRV